MAYNNYQQVPFWDFVRAFDQTGSGAGVDHAAEAHNHPFFGPPGPPPPPPPHAGGSHPPPPPPPGAFPWGGAGFGGPPFWGHGRRGGFGGHGGRGGRRGRHCHRERESGEERSRSRTASPSGPEGEGREDNEHGHEGPRGPRRHGRGGRHGHRGGWGGPHGHGQRGPPPFGGPGGFDLSGLFNALNNSPISQHPWAQFLRQYAEQAGLGGDGQRSGETLVPEDTEDTFVPPIDVFSTETAYILHIALPGAKKEDVGVNWDSDKGELNVAGVVYRQGDEAFLKTLSQSERKVGVFERSVKLPPGAEEKEEVDGEGITAKLEDGVLVVTVPKVEREWTEVKRVDIE